MLLAAVIDTIASLPSTASHAIRSSLISTARGHLQGCRTALRDVPEGFKSETEQAMLVVETQLAAMSPTTATEDLSKVCLFLNRVECIHAD